MQRRAVLTLIVVLSVIISQTTSGAKASTFQPPQQPGWSLSTDSYFYNFGDTVTFVVTKPQSISAHNCIVDVSFYIVVTLPDGSQNEIGPIGFPDAAGTYSETAGQAGPPPGTRQAELWGQSGVGCVTPLPSPVLYATASYVVIGTTTTTPSCQYGGTYPNCNPSPCSGGQYWNGAQCVCPSGQQWNGYQCVTLPQQPQIQVHFANILAESANNYVDLAKLIVSKLTFNDVIVWVYVTSGGANIKDMTITYSPSSAFEQIYSGGYNNPTRWAFELKAPLIKDFIQDILVTIVITGICVGSQFLPPPIDVAGLQACAQYVESKGLMDLAGYLNDLPQLIQIISRIVTLDSVAITYQDGSAANVPSSAIQFQEGSSRFPTFLDTLNSVASKQSAAHVVSVHSPVRLLIVDSQGRKTGEDSSGQVFNDIPESITVIPGTTVLLPPELANYNVQLIGTGDGSYQLAVAYASGSLSVSVTSGTVSAGQAVTYAVTNSNNQLNVSPTNGESSWSWTNFGLAAVVTIVLVIVSSEVILRRRRHRARRWFT